MSPEDYDRFAKDDPNTKALMEQALDAARWRAFVRSTGHETDMSTGPGAHKDMHIRLNCTGCERYLESGAPDWKATLEAVMDDEIRLQASQLPPGANTQEGQS